MKNIIICCDGTGNTFGDNLTNVAKVVRFVENSDKQVVYYDPGVGTVNFFGISLRNLVWFEFGKAFGWGIASRVNEAYKYLMEMYEDGDRIFLFGFSRGAYTVRALSGMLHKCGLLRKGNENLLPYVENLYYRQNNEVETNEFKQGLCRDCVPYFLGLWDTVNSRGYLTTAALFMDTDLHPDIKYAYHALSIDEKRKMFKPLLLNEPPKHPDQIIEQTWFIGTHSDVGGFYTDDSGLSDITLKWMLTKAQLHDMLIKPGWESKINPYPNGILHESRLGLWKIWKVFKRVIPDNSIIHSSVFKRTREHYKPLNLPTRLRISENDTDCYSDYRVITKSSPSP